MSLLSRIRNIFKYDVPTRSDALFWLTGRILLSGGNYYFFDKSGNGRHFLITGYDFDSDWNLGMPYKTAATISAPAGDAVLIAADVNNYLYDSGGIPNEIPVVSLFQNVDYADKLFCRHKAQILDSNGVEIYQPRVIDIVLYDTVKTGADLIACNSFFGVPVEITSNVRWVDPVNGLDANAGTKASPWQTLTKSTSSSTVGDTVYVKTGICDLTAAIWNNSSKILYHKCIGLNTTNLGVRYIYPNAGSMDRFVLNATSSMILELGTFKAVFTNCKFYGGGSHIAHNANASFELTNCIGIGYTVTFAYSKGSCTLNTCYIKSSGAVNASVIRNADTASDFIVSNCKIDSHSIIGPASGFSASTINDITIKGNKINLVSYCLSINDFNNFVFYGNDIITATTLFSATQTTPSVSNVDVQRNRIYSTAANNAIACVNKNFVCKYNHITTTVGIDIVHFSKGDVLTTDIGNNTVNTTGEGVPIVVGDSTFVIKDKITGSIYNNKVLGGDYFGEVTQDHGVCVWANAGVSIHHNYIEGWDIAIVLKGGNCDYSTNLVFSNYIKDGYIAVRGVSNTPIYGNTFLMSRYSQVAIDCLTDELANEALNTQIKNNIFVNTFATNTNVFIDLENASTATIDNNLYYFVAGTYVGKVSGVNRTFAQWQALGYDTNSLFQNPNLVDELYPLVPIEIGENLGPDYDYGLDISTNWGDDNHIPVIVTKQQSTNWQVGAYVK